MRLDACMSAPVAKYLSLRADVTHVTAEYAPQIK